MEKIQIDHVAWYESLSIMSEGVELVIPEEGLCIYCQKEFKDLHNHVKIFHPGTYASDNVIRQEGNGPDSNSQGRGE